MQTSSTGVSRTRQVVAAVIGNALEWYDFIVYGFLASIIARQFFPSDDAYASLLMALATFGVGFFMRPVGGVLLGMYSDRKGRKAAMQMIIRLMTVSIAMIAFAPDYLAIGMAAPLLIVVARMLQGFATGGEYASATAFLVESAPAHRKGLYGSWQLVGQCLAVFSGAAMVALVTHLCSPEALDSWGWRIPFVLGLLIGPVGLWIRKHMEEPEAFVEARRHAKGQSPSLWQVLREHRRSLLVSMGLACGATVSFYVVLVNMPTFAHKSLGLPLDQVLLVQMLAVGLMTLVIPLSGALSDRLGRRPVLMAFTLAFFVMVYPLYVWMAAAPSLERLLVMQLLLCTAIGGFFGPAPTALAEQFPVQVRSTGVSVAYNVAVMVFGGFAPLIVTWLTQVLGTPVAPAFYVLFACLLTLLGTYCLKEAPRVVKPAAFNLGVKP
ncbi:citrate-proton symporter [Pseudomonas sp. DCB_CB]|jgi:MFS family permease|uniref:Major facilitator transporter n=1 Tax=Pseudomonas putida TRO1 TaxID=1227924 RepID=A0AAD2WAA2_PSEPU|nr:MULTISPECIES: citrate-proton symporter [Pseudomonas]ELS0922349.1 MFS transporter [Pseudomonas putida]ENY76776.1 Major facilitator transporter [Pseudomonas putida TRO1]MCF1250496.1 citrate-proton symporter [Pseudomonas putida]MCX2690334.1 citrate-proton symporter [Pseudomonas sp. DCB_BZ]MCX2854775.1 citrate-proton symporter [Pseudomonas sp. DCB_CB]